VAAFAPQHSAPKPRRGERGRWVARGLCLLIRATER
jgi:hypothetical protein